MKTKNSKIPKKSPNSSIFLSDEDDDIDQFRKLEEAVQQDSSSDPDLFLNPDRLKKKFPNLFNETDINQKISPSSSFDENDKIFPEKNQSYPDNTEQILQLTNDLHQAFRLVTQKKAELEREQQKFIKEKKNFAKEKARYESEQIFADTEAGNSASYMLLNQKYKALKDKYKFKKNEWQKEKQQYISQIKMLNEKINELNSQKNFSPNRTNSIAHFDTSSDSEPSNSQKTHKNIIQTNDPQRNTDINNGLIDNPFNLINVSPSMKSKQPQNNMNQNLNENIINNTDFKKLSFDGSDNESDNDQFDIIEDNNINYNSNNLYTQPNSNKDFNANQQIETQVYQQAPQIQNFNPNPQFENQEFQSTAQSKQLSPKIPESLKSADDNSIDAIETQMPAQIEQKENKFTAFRNWDDYDDDSDSYLKNQNENDLPKIEKPLVFRAVIPKGSQNSNNGSKIDSSPPLAKKSKNSGESSILNSKLKVQKNENNKVQKNENNKVQKIDNKVQKKFSSPTKKKSKFDAPLKKVTPNNENEIASDPPDESIIQKRLTSYPALFNMNDPNNKQKVSPTSLIKSSSPIESPSKEMKSKDKKANFSIFENYDVNFDVNLGNVIEEKDGANKKKIIKYFDGSTEIIFPNGTRKVTRSNCVYVFYQNGDISQDFNDGARAYKYSNGTIDLTLPNGIILCVFPNGQREKHFLNGDKEIIYPTGETKYLKANV